MMGKSIVRTIQILGTVGVIALVAVVSTAHPQGDAARGAHPQGDPARGEMRFEECASCHSVAAGENGVGPTLEGMFNRKAGSRDDFRYSPAMRNSDITWTAEALDAFIADPQKVIPGNRMSYAGLTDAVDRQDVIAYLQQATK
jgi:cytochrome c2